MDERTVVRLDKCTIVKNHIIRMGTYNDRDVYYFVDIQKYWIAPHCYHLRTNMTKGHTYLILTYFDGDTLKTYTNSYGNIEKLDFSRIMEIIEPKLAKRIEQFGCRRFRGMLLNSKPYTVYRREKMSDILQVHALSNNVAGSEYVGTCQVTNRSEIRKLIRKARELGNKILAQRRATINIPIEEVFKTLTHNPLVAATKDIVKPHRLGHRALVERHIDKMGVWNHRQVYYFKDIKKYWVAPYGVSLISALKNPPYLHFYLSVRYRDNCNAIDINRSIGSVDTLDFYTVFDAIKSRLMPLLKENGCHHFNPALLTSNLYHIAKIPTIGEYRVTALKSSTEVNQPNLGRKHIGCCKMDDWSELRQLLRTAVHASKAVLAERKATINLPLDEAFQLLDTNPLED